MKKVIYLCAGNGIINLPGFDIKYNDKFIKRDFTCDCFDVDISNFDIFIGSPPCNFYSKANYRRYISDYSLDTFSILPTMLKLFYNSGKPFIIENVINKPLMFRVINDLPLDIFYFEAGRHCYFTNIYFHFNDKFSKADGIAHMSQKKRQGSGGVNLVFSRFLSFCY